MEFTGKLSGDITGTHIVIDGGRSGTGGAAISRATQTGAPRPA